jgi:hypothetical protein
MRDSDDAELLARMIEDFQPGLYRHYKGQQYLALCLARADETDEVVVVYTRLYPRPGLPTSTRKLQIWNQEVEVDGRRVPRFAYCGHATDDAQSEPGQNPNRRGLLGWMKDNF